MIAQKRQHNPKATNISIHSKQVLSINPELRNQFKFSQRLAAEPKVNIGTVVALIGTLGRYRCSPNHRYLNPRYQLINKFSQNVAGT